MSATANDKGATQQPVCAAERKGRWLSARNVFIAAVVVASGALYFGWSALVAAGLASVIIGVLPCLAMCALGLCMGRMGKKDADEQESARQPQSKVRR